MKQNEQAKPQRRKQIPHKVRWKIYERDNRTCQICGEETRFFQSLYDIPFSDKPKAGSIDHIIPVSKGGSDHESNLRWACRSCNCSRGNRS